MMKRLQFLIGISLLLAISIVAFGNSLSEEKQRSHLQSLRKATSQTHLTQFDRAYVDLISLLEQSNPCSEFFGGAASAQAFDSFAVTLKNGFMKDPGIGLVMSGWSTNKLDVQTGLSYRLFSKTEINTIGAFYRARVWPEGHLVPKVGTFRPNTREARVLILLHELAHLIRGTDGAWLIPDDGGNPELSRRNTYTVESKCGPEIRAL